MCGRFTLSQPFESVKQHFNLGQHAILTPKYNIAPGDLIPVIKTTGILDFMSWGFKPTWAKAIKPLHNARLETITEKPMFRTAFQKRRCLVVADGYYEWKDIAQRKVPYYIKPKDTNFCIFAAIWENNTCAIITHPANSNLVAIHDRMPVVLTADAYALWLNPKVIIKPEEIITSLIIKEFIFYPVSSQVNNNKNDCKENLLPIT